MSNLTLPSEEELREALNNGEITIEEFQLLLEYFYGATFPDLRVVGGAIPNLDLIGVSAFSQLDKLQQEQLAEISGAEREGTSKRSSRIGAWSRMYIDQELNNRERARRVFQFGIGGARGWSFDGSVASAYGQSALWRSRTLQWNKKQGATLALVFGNYDLHWGTGLALGRRGRLLAQHNDLSFESLLTPDRGGFNGLSVAGVTAINAKRTFSWRAIGSTQRDVIHRLNTVGLMGATSSATLTVGALWARSTLISRDGSGEFVQEQYSLSIRRARSHPLWLNAELNTQSNEGALSSALNAEWRYNIDDGNVRGAIWHYPRSYRNLTGGARSGILYESIEFEELAFSYRDRRINQTGGLLRSVTALGENNKIETGLELSSQGRNGDTRGDYIFAIHHRIHDHELKLEASGRTVTNSTVEMRSRWRIRAQVTSHTAKTRVRAALRYLKQVSDSPALGLFARISRRFRTGAQLELWLDVARFRWWQGGLERFYSYVQFAAPLDKGGAVRLLTKLVYRYSELDSHPSRVVARLEISAGW